MADYRILFGDSTVTLRRELPEDFASVTAGEITITNSGGSELLAATAVTVPTATTLATTINAGANTCTVAGGTWEPGDILRVEDSNSGPPEDFIVQSFNASSKAVTVEDRFQYSHASTTAVCARWVTYSLDASDSGDFANLTEGSIVWDAWTPDNPGIQNTFIVSKRTLGVGGLEQEFANLYSKYAAAMAEGTWRDFEDAAINNLVQRFEPYGQDFLKLVSTTQAKYLIMAMIAYLFARAQGEDWSYERDTMHNELDRMETQFRSIRKWFDTDEDLVRDDEEWQSHKMPNPSRGYQ